MNKIEMISAAKTYQRQALQEVLSQIKDLGDGTYSVPKRFFNGKVADTQIITKDELECYILRQMSLSRSEMSETLLMQDDLNSSIWQTNDKMSNPRSWRGKEKEISIFNLK